MIQEAFDFLKQVFQEWNEDRVPRLAAALAYYTIFSLAPLLIVAIAAVGIVYSGQAAESAIIGAVSDSISPSAADVVQGLINNAYEAEGSVISTLISIGLVIFTSTILFDQLQSALNTIWDVEPEEGGGIVQILLRKAISFGMVLIIGLLLLISLIASTAISAAAVYATELVPGVEFLIRIANFAIAFGVTMLLFAAIYRLLPNAKIAWRDVWVGSAITALLFSIGRFVLALYLGTTSTTSVYGAAGSFVLILLWVFYSAQLILLGAEITQVYARRYGSQIIRAGTEEQQPQQLEPSNA
jgi:membrane protein